MDPTWLKLLEEDVTDKPMTTSASDTQMPPPEEPQELQKFLGMTTYPVTVHPFPLDVHCTPARTAAERFKVHLERLLPRSLRHCQADGLQGHNTSILRLTETSCHPGRCITEGTRSSTPARWTPHRLHFQGSHPDRATICQHRT